MTAARTILVTDGDQRSALAVVRSLGRAGHRVYVCSTRERSLAGASRYAAGEAPVRDPLADPEGCAVDVLALIDRWHIDTLLPTTDAALFALLPHRDDRPNVLIPVPPLAAVRRIADKEGVLALAPRFGIAVPAQHALARLPDSAALASLPVEYPVVVKSTRSVVDDGTGRTKVSVRHAANADQLRSILQTLDPAAYPVLLQRRIVGPGVGIFLLLWNGEVCAAFSHRRIREKPPVGGVSVYREAIALDPVLLQRSRELLAAFGWNGVAMIEFKIDERSGTPYLMEINGRFWGSLQLAIDAGVDFPVLLLAAALGERPRCDAYRIGIRSRWWWGDVDHLIARLRHSRADLALPDDAPGRWAAVRDFLTPHPGVNRSEILRRDDPYPFVRETLAWLRRN